MKTMGTPGISETNGLDPARDPVAFTQARLKIAEIESPRFEAQTLVGMVLGLSRAAITAQLFDPLSPSQIAQLLGFIDRREKREPLAYIRGTQEFYGREFIVSADTLIPRPETEGLVEFALEKMSSDSPYNFVEIGTGSGCIAISILAERPLSTCVATDISERALKIARRNAEKHNVTDRIELRHADLTEGLPTQSCDLIISNPPYIPSGEISSLQPEVARFEPKLALDGGADGLELYRRLIAQATVVLRPGGWIALEIGMGQSESVSALLALEGFADREIRLDLAGIGRIAIGRR